MLAALVETKQLMEVAMAALLAGIGITAAFSVAILASTRLAEHRRAGHRVAAGAYGVLATIALIVVAAGVAYGLHEMTSKG